MSHKHIVHISDVPSEPLPAPDGTSFGGLRQRVGVAVGAQKLGYGLFTVAPGKAAFPLHAHTLNEELIYILDGEGTLRFGAETVAVRAGMFIACPGGPGVDPSTGQYVGGGPALPVCEHHAVSRHRPLSRTPTRWVSTPAPVRPVKSRFAASTRRGPWCRTSRTRPAPR